MENKIYININKNLSRLVGEAEGIELYLNQIKGKIDYDKINVIVIPKHVECVSISYAKGLAKNILDEIPLDKFYEIIKFEGNSEIVNKINKSIWY